MNTPAGMVHSLLLAVRSNGYMLGFLEVENSFSGERALEYNLLAKLQISYLVTVEKEVRMNLWQGVQQELCHEHSSLR